MRLFQNSGVYRAYLPRLRQLTQGCATFADQTRVFLDDRYGACHLLLPVLESNPMGFFTNGDDNYLQGRWARENGLPDKTTLEEILLAQIEQHRTEVFYNLDPMRYSSDFVRKLPGCVKKAIAWRAAPSPGADFSAYDLMVCNFPGILESWKTEGIRCGYFSPAHDPRMDCFSVNEDRPLDVLFVGGYSRHHARRARVLDAVSNLARHYRVRYHLDHGRLTRLADSPLGCLPGLRKHRRPPAVRSLSQGPIFGIDLYQAIGNSKIVLNGAVDMAANDRGNMRCFEAMGCGALLVSDSGHYPQGMIEGSTMLSYSSPAEAVSVIERALTQWSATKLIARRAYAMVRDRYSKTSQWETFQRLVASL